MTRAPAFCGVILATGAALRDGRDKALLPWPPLDPAVIRTGGTFLSGAIDSLQRHTDLIIVVTAKNATTLEPVIYTRAASMVVNSAPELGDFNSLKLGLREVLNRGRDAAFIAVADRPPVFEATVARLHASFLKAIDDDKWAVVPHFEGAPGYPYVIGREMIEAFLRAPLTAAASDIKDANAQHIIEVAVEDPMVTATVETVADYDRLAAISRPTQESRP
jgi:CTP:molybdopterin cytidylyltransferase MocA